MNHHIIFVYGTLKRGFHNHGYLEREAEYLGEAYVRGALYQNYLPYVVESKEYSVKGELYRVTQEKLHQLDRLEGHPEWYRRHLAWPHVDQQILKPHPTVPSAWVYAMSEAPEGARLVESGVYERAPLNGALAL